MKKNISNDDLITITAGWNKDNIFIPIKDEAREAIKKALPKKLSKDSAFYKQVKLAVSQSPQVQRAVAGSTPQKTVDAPEAKAKREAEEKKLDTIKILSSVLIPTDKKVEFTTSARSNGILYEDAIEIRPGFATLNFFRRSSTLIALSHPARPNSNWSDLRSHVRSFTELEWITHVS